MKNVILTLLFATLTNQSLAEDSTPALVLRQARGKVQINKIWIEKNEKKVFERKSEVLCSKSIASINVFEFSAEKPLSPTGGGTAVCNTELDGQKITVIVAPIIAEGITDGAFSEIIDPNKRIKIAYTLLQVLNGGSSVAVQPFQFNSFLTEDLSVKSIYSVITPSINQWPTETCDQTGCRTEFGSSSKFYFEAVVKVDDYDAK